MKAFCYSLLLLIGLSFSLHGQTSKYPLMEYSSADNLVITQINIQDFGQGLKTFITFELSPLQDEYFMVPSGMYINDANDARRRFELISVDHSIFKLDQWSEIKKGEIYKYILVFEGIPSDIESINMYEPQLEGVAPWVWRKIRIKSALLSQLETNAAPIKKEQKKIIGY